MNRLFLNYLDSNLRFRTNAWRLNLSRLHFDSLCSPAFCYRGQIASKNILKGMKSPLERGQYPKTARSVWFVIQGCVQIKPWNGKPVPIQFNVRNTPLAKLTRLRRFVYAFPLSRGDRINLPCQCILAPSEFLGRGVPDFLGVVFDAQLKAFPNLSMVAKYRRFCRYVVETSPCYKNAKHFTPD